MDYVALKISYLRLTLSRAREQYCTTGATKAHPVYLNCQHFCGDNTCQKLFPEHISVSCLQTRFSCNAEMLILRYMCTAIIGFARGRVNLQTLSVVCILTHVEY